MSRVSGSRWLECPSVLNLRDLGGLPLGSGEVLPRGRLLRSGSLARICEQDAAWLVERLGLRTVVDLRTPGEVARDGRAEPLLARGVRWWSLPLEDARQLPRSPGPSDYLERYELMLQKVGPVLSALLVAIAEDQLPLVFGCTAGKDRTGVVAALLLAALGVEERAITADYALTARHLRRRLELFQSHWERKGLTAQQYARRLEARPETMRGLLERCRARYGSLSNTLARLGVEPEQVVAARERLLRGPPAPGWGPATGR